jgi:hypothetical protein
VEVLARLKPDGGGIRRPRVNFKVTVRILVDRRLTRGKVRRHDAFDDAASLGVDGGRASAFFVSPPSCSIPPPIHHWRACQSGGFKCRFLREQRQPIAPPSNG